MALGALLDSTANVAVATTGILGPEDVDGIPAGTVCFAWAYQTEQGKCVFTQQHRFLRIPQQGPVIGRRTCLEADLVFFINVR